MASFLRLLKWELRKLLLRKRTAVGFAFVFCFELLLLAMLQRQSVRDELRQTIRRAGFTFEENFTGPTIASFMLNATMTIVGTLQVALVAGEIVSKEIEDGTMRMMLCRPVRRRTVLLAKLVTCLVFTALLTGFVCLTALILGLLYKGPGYWLIISAKEDFVAHHEFVPGLYRYFQATVLTAASICSVAVLGFMLSCLKMKPAAAAIMALAFFIVDDTLRNLPFFAGVREHFIMSRITSWLHIYDRRIPWTYLLESYSVLFAFDAACVCAGYLAFRRRDLKP